jgi:hypothetical protein
MNIGKERKKEFDQSGLEWPPAASMLMQSLRSVGYSAAAALADLIDNSISANAHTIRIGLLRIPEPTVTLIDDGSGMTEDALLLAMRFGSRDPRDQRDDTDLGRFGLGLKTASLSQCRRLTVASLWDGKLSAARWDLDECDRRGTWWLQRPGVDDLPQEAVAKLLEQGHGTAVIWEKLDRLESAGGDRAIVDAADYLTLVFHRFLSGEMVGPFTIFLNGRAIDVIDPFLEGHTRGQALHTERIEIDGHTIVVSPFVLPFPSRLKPGDIEKAGGKDSLKSSHGFYIYRGGRLIVPGGWFRIVPSDDLFRLARVKVDVPVELDHLWKVDIRKTIAEPPPALRSHLKRIVGDVAQRSRKVYTHRSLPANDVGRVSLWKRFEFRDGGVTWMINREHPLVQCLLEHCAGSSAALELLKHLEENLPIHDIHIHTSNDQRIAELPGLDEVEMEATAKRLMEAFRDKPEIAGRVLESLPMTEPFSRHPEMARRVLERLQS